MLLAKTAYFVEISQLYVELSVIIVNFNVKHFLEQCLYSVRNALRQTTGEIIVVDNNSTDQSLDYLQPKFPDVQFIANTENTGFAKACNQGLAHSRGRYVLFLNPDTLVPEDCFTHCLAFFSRHPRAGGIGCKMLDGSGRFLKESKRAFPAPLTSMYKLFGLAALFPRSAHFARYHLGHLPENSDNEVDVLAGAFMLIPREVLEKTGGFDERFFMYGEDVDLSYRIQQAGYKNYYVAGAPIIHFKGESTRKGSMNYVRMFYTAMSLFVRKHYGSRRAGLFNLLIHLAIWFRAMLSTIGQFIRRAGLPLIDAGLILLSFFVVKEIWTGWIRPDIAYDTRLLWMAIPGYTLVYLLSAWYAGLYDKWYRRSQLLHSSVIATITLLAVYSLLPEQLRFSRGIVLFGALLAYGLIALLRFVLVNTGVISSARKRELHHTIVIAGSAGEYQEALQLLDDAGVKQQVLGRAGVDPQEPDTIGNYKQLRKLGQVLPFREVIFCQGTLTYRAIIEAIGNLPEGISAKVHAAGSGSMIGSESKDSSGESVSKENVYQLADPYNRRLKRLLDTGLALFLLLTCPVQFLLVRKPAGLIRHIFQVLSGQKSWIGYAGKGTGLPRLRPGVLGSNGQPVATLSQISEQSLYTTDYWYARDYTVPDDIRLLLRAYRLLGG